MKIIKDKTHNVWFTSDTHFGHVNIVSGTTQWDMDRVNNGVRDFDTVEDMNRTVVDNINKVVMPDDTLVHLGDWSFGGIENIWNLRNRIMCKNIILVFGNHDHHIEGNKTLPNCHYDSVDVETVVDGSPNFTYGDGRDDMFVVHSQDLFLWTGHYLNLTVVDNTNQGKGGKSPRMELVCTHYPMASWDKLGKGRVHLHGHIHTPKQFIIPKVGKMMDVGVDGNDLKPWSFDDVRRLMRKQEIGSLLRHGFDHHVDPNTH